MFIYLFQELDEFDSFYKGKMQELGYSSIYMKRSGEKKRDGCGIFYKDELCVQLFFAILDEVVVLHRPVYDLDFV